MKLPRRATLLLAVLVPALLAAGLAGFWFFHYQGSAGPQPPPPLFQPTSQFVIGVNYPWRVYGGDFGANVWGSHDGVNTPAGLQDVDKDFAYLASVGLHVVRWFVFTDGRGGLVFNKDGSVAGIDQYVLGDMRAALEIAHKHEIRVVFVILDFNFIQRSTWVADRMVGGHRWVVERPAFTAGFEDNVMKPILAAFGETPDIAAWEIVNEPEWVTTEFPFWEIRKVGVRKMQDFVTSMASYIKQRAKQPVTVGSASLAGMRIWESCGLDFLQFHSYPYLERRNPLDQPAAGLGYTVPVVLGEFPTNNTTRGTDQYIDIMYRNGYLGAVAWSYRARDKYTNLGQQIPAVAAWQKAHLGKPGTP